MNTHAGRRRFDIRSSHSWVGSHSHFAAHHLQSPVFGGGPVTSHALHLARSTAHRRQTVPLRGATAWDPRQHVSWHTRRQASQ